MKRDTFRRNDSSSALLLLGGGSLKKKGSGSVLRKGFSENSARNELAEKLARLDSVSDSWDEDKEDEEEEAALTTDETKGIQTLALEFICIKNGMKMTDILKSFNSKMLIMN